MDSLIVSLEKFAIHKDEKKFENHLDIIMGNLNLNNLKEDADLEWDLLKSDYSKIRYICQLLNHYHYILPTKFFDLLKIFTDGLDKTTNIYISLMDEDTNGENCDEELRHYYKKIKKYFNESLESKNDVGKIELLLKGYDLLVPIIEDFRREKYYDNIDEEFKETYNPKKMKK